MHVTANSKEVKPGSIFVAIKGSLFDGHDYIQEAQAQGASEIYAEYDTGIKGVKVIGNLARKKLAELAGQMFDRPTEHLKMIGVTGTSGKTTTTYLIHHLFESAGIACARLGTNGGYFRGNEISTANTTPGAVDLQKWFAHVKSQGAQAVVMEVSSHALDQDRAWAIAWDAAVFLNLSPEHMDYHPTLEHYLGTKARLFTEHAEYAKLKSKSPTLLSNADNEYGAKLLEQYPDIDAYSVSKQMRKIRDTSTGISFEVDLGQGFKSGEAPLFGAFQTENVLAALSVVRSFGVSDDQLIAGLKTFAGVPGRMEFIPNQKELFVFVDYAHKPEALEKVLSSLKLSEAERKQGRKIITVFGCGGDRDKTKRPVMGEIATRLSDWVILTSDNPRNEDPAQILREIEAGITLSHFEVIPDRAQAIAKGVSLACPKDIVLIAGKGHEDYQIIGKTKHHFDDREQARLALTT